MKRFFKMVGSFWLDQFVGIIGGSMMVLPVVTFFKDNMMLGYTLAFIFSFGFYAYVLYNSAFKSGFRDEKRITKDPSYRGYLYKGALGGVVAALPTAIFFVCCMIFKEILYLYYEILTMYWTWPLGNILLWKNPHLVMGLAMVPTVLLPWIGYIAGYKNFSVFDKVLTAYRKFMKMK